MSEVMEEKTEVVATEEKVAPKRFKKTSRKKSLHFLWRKSWIYWL